MPQDSLESVHLVSLSESHLLDLKGYSLFLPSPSHTLLLFFSPSLPPSLPSSLPSFLPSWQSLLWQKPCFQCSFALCCDPSPSLPNAEPRISGFGWPHDFLPPQVHTQNPLQVGSEFQFHFFTSQGYAQNPFQALPAPPPTHQASVSEPLQVDLLLVLAATQVSCCHCCCSAPGPGCHLHNGHSACEVAGYTPFTNPTSVTHLEAIPLVSAITIAIAAATAVAAPTLTVAVAQVASALKKKRARAPISVCALCIKEFKNSYNLRFHKAIYT